MNNASKKTSSFGFETKLLPDKVISTAVRFFSSKNYKVQSQGSDWITFEPAKGKYPNWSVVMTGMIGGVLIAIGIVGLVRSNQLSESIFSSAYESNILLLRICGIGGIILGPFFSVWSVWMAKLSKLPQNITITVETLSSGTRVTIEHPSQKKVETLIGELIPLLPG